MPTGTGKTITLLSLITSYQLAHPEVRWVVVAVVAPGVAVVATDLLQLQTRTVHTQLSGLRQERFTSLPRCIHVYACTAPCMSEVGVSVARPPYALEAAQCVPYPSAIVMPFQSHTVLVGTNKQPLPYRLAS